MSEAGPACLLQLAFTHLFPNTLTLEQAPRHSWSLHVARCLDVSFQQHP